jgi:Flp pilus assembly protein TadD
MDRYFVRTAAIVVCAAWAAGCGSTASDKANAPVAAAATPNPRAPTQSSAAAAGDLPTTLNGEIARAEALRAAGSYDEAASAFGQLMLVAPDDVRVVSGYGKVLTQQGRPDQALPFLNRAIQIDANDWTLYSALGVAYDQTDQHTKARAAYEHALALKPGQPDVLNNYAVSRMLSGNLGDAQKLLTEASAPGTGDAKIGNNLALLETMKPATASPKPLTGVVMESLPADPQAGSVAARKSPAHKLAAVKKPKAKDTSVALRHDTTTPPAELKPVLRTADGQ